MGQPAGHRRRPDPPAAAARARAARRRDRTGRAPAYRPVFFDDWVDAAGLLAAGPRPPATWSTGPAVIEEFGSTVPLHPGFAATVDELGNLLVSREAA